MIVGGAEGFDIARPRRAGGAQTIGVILTSDF
jgi:hypothetical protein